MNYFKLTPSVVKGLSASALFFIGMLSSAHALEIEAEDMTLAGYSIKNSVHASNGQYIQLSANPATASVLNYEASGFKDIKVHYFDETDGDSTYTLLVDGVVVETWLSDNPEGTSGVSAESLTFHTINNVYIATGGEIQISAVKSGGEYCRLDLLEVNPSQTVRFQSEDLQLQSFSVKSNSLAEGGKYIQISGGSGSATLDFGGESGIYTIDTYYFDETDGACSFDLIVDGTVVDSWVANRSLGSAGLSVNNRTRHTSYRVQLQNGSSVTWSSLKNGSEYSRMDVAVVTKVFDFEAEFMVRENTMVSSSVFASGGKLARLSGLQGSVSQIIPEVTEGSYDLVLDYFDESDGKCAYEVYVENRLVDAWLADKQLGSAGVAESNKTNRVIRSVYLHEGDVLEVLASLDGSEYARMDRLSIHASPDASPRSSFELDAAGELVEFRIDTVDFLNVAKSFSMSLEVFNGDVVQTEALSNLIQDGNVYQFGEDERARLRVDAFDHHVAVRLVDLEEIPLNHDAYGMKLVIPFSGNIGVVPLDDDIEITVESDQIVIEWTDMSERGLIPGGSFALYRNGSNVQNQVALDEIENAYRIEAVDVVVTSNFAGNPANGNTTLVADLATSELTAFGTITGPTADHISDNVYEILTEEEDGNQSLMEHEWTFDVLGGSAVALHIEAYRTANSEGDDFVFSYSSNGTDWTEAITIIKTADNDMEQVFALPVTTSGAIYIDVLDTDRTAGNIDLDSLFIDTLYISSE